MIAVTWSYISGCTCVTHSFGIVGSISGTIVSVTSGNSGTAHLIVGETFTASSAVKTGGNCCVGEGGNCTPDVGVSGTHTGYASACPYSEIGPYTVGSGDTITINGSDDGSA